MQDNENTSKPDLDNFKKLKDKLTTVKALSPCGNYVALPDLNLEEIRILWSIACENNLVRSQILNPAYEKSKTLFKLVKCLLSSNDQPLFFVRELSRINIFLDQKTRFRSKLTFDQIIEGK